MSSGRGCLGSKTACELAGQPTHSSLLVHNIVPVLPPIGPMVWKHGIIYKTGSIQHIAMPWWGLLMSEMAGALRRPSTSPGCG